MNNNNVFCIIYYLIVYTANGRDMAHCPPMATPLAESEYIEIERTSLYNDHLYNPIILIYTS